MIDEDDRDAARQRLAAALGSSSCRPEWAAAFAEQCLDYFRIMELPTPSSGRMAFLIPRYRWVVRDEDLGLAESLFGSASAVVGANLLVGSEVTTAVIGVVAGVFTLCRGAYRKGARLSEDETKLLVVLKSSGNAMSVEALAERLNATRQAGAPEWCSTRTQELLGRLERTRLHDGTVAALVERDGNGLWGCAGV